MRKSSLNKNSPYDLSITEIGAQGDGVSTRNGHIHYVPFSAPGDRISARTVSRRGEGIAAEIERLVEPSPLRAEPACGHFGRCGGCALQHLTPDFIAGHKRDLLKRALSHRGLDSNTVTETVIIPPHSRRRLRFSINRAGKPVLGFKVRRGHEIIDIQECPLAAPEIEALLPHVRRILPQLPALGKRGELTVAAVDNGLDLLFAPVKPAELGLVERECLATFAATQKIARISWDGPSGVEPVAARETPYLTFGGSRVKLPAGAFLQPSAAGERAIAECVTVALNGCRSCADLYAGCGTLAFPLSAFSKVHCFEINDDMVDAIRRAEGTKPTATVRDLAAQPLTAKELVTFDGIVFDPPRAGARAQAEELAQSDVSKIAAVSCNPATFARDLRILTDGGYSIVRITPIDQFAWSPHLEAVAELRRI